MTAGYILKSRVWIAIAKCQRPFCFAQGLAFFWSDHVPGTREINAPPHPGLGTRDILEEGCAGFSKHWWRRWVRSQKFCPKEAMKAQACRWNPYGSAVRLQVTASLQTWNGQHCNVKVRGQMLQWYAAVGCWQLLYKSVKYIYIYHIISYNVPPPPTKNAVAVGISQ